MSRRTGLNAVNQFPTYLAGHLRRARKDPEVLALLQGMDEVVYGGLPLPADDRDWARKNGINLRVFLRFFFHKISPYTPVGRIWKH